MRRPGRNDEGPIDPDGKTFSIFNYLGRPNGSCTERYVTGEELHVAHTFILWNCPEVEPYLEQFRASMSGLSPDEVDQMCNQHFAHWFRNYVHTNPDIQEKAGLLYHLSFGPRSRSKTWPAYFINGYNFHTQEYGKGKATMNSGVCVQSSCNLMDDWYGLLDEIIQVEYPGPLMHVVLFKCTWFDPVKGMRVNSKYNLIEVNHKSRYKKYEPFVLAQQAIQVSFLSYPSLKRDKLNWWAACKIKARKKIVEHWKDKVGAYQQESVIQTVDVTEYNITNLQDPLGTMVAVDTSEIRESNLGESDEEDEFHTDDEDSDDEDEYDDDSDDEDEYDDDSDSEHQPQRNDVHDQDEDD